MLAKSDMSVGYVQGMNYIVSILMYHAGEVGAYALMKVLLEEFDLKQVYAAGFPGLKLHNQNL